MKWIAVLLLISGDVVFFERPTEAQCEAIVRQTILDVSLRKTVKISFCVKVERTTETKL